MHRLEINYERDLIITENVVISRLNKSLASGTVAASCHFGFALIQLMLMFVSRDLT